MPYIICVNQPGYLPEADPMAVATIEEVADAIEAEADRRFDDIEPYTAELHSQYRNIIEAWHSMDEEAGGTVGPLPDGYVIDVRRVGWKEMTDLAGVMYAAHPDRQEDPPEHVARDILDAYNQQ